MARAKGVHLGRPPRPTPEGFEEYYALWRAKQLSFTDFAQKLDVTETQLKWLVRKNEKRQLLGKCSRLFFLECFFPWS